MRQLRTLSSTDWLFAFCGLWTMIQMVMVVSEYFHLSPSILIPEKMPIAYFLLLFFYVLRKETERWLKRLHRKRRGEIFFWGWWVLTLILFVISGVTNEHYQVPVRLLENCGYITLVFAGGQFSKVLYYYRAKRRTLPPKMGS